MKLQDNKTLRKRDFVRNYKILQDNKTQAQDYKIIIRHKRKITR